MARDSTEESMREAIIETMRDAMADGLMTMILDKIREGIMEVDQPDIDSPVYAACKTFKVAVEAYRNPSGYDAVVHVFIQPRNKD
jgi:hypothetical protein